MCSEQATPKSNIAIFMKTSFLKCSFHKTKFEHLVDVLVVMGFLHLKKSASWHGALMLHLFFFLGHFLFLFLAIDELICLVLVVTGVPDFHSSH